MRVLCFGDSITQGLSDPELGGWANRFFIAEQARSVATDWERDITVFNLGISGDTSTDLLQRFGHELNARIYEGVQLVTIIAIGINDASINTDTNTNLVSFETFSQNMQKLVTQGQEQGAVCVIGLADFDESLMDPQPWEPQVSLYERDRDRYDAELERIANELRIPFISMRGLFADNLQKYLVDGLHPNAEGHKRMFERIYSRLEQEQLL